METDLTGNNGVIRYSELSKGMLFPEYEYELKDIQILNYLDGVEEFGSMYRDIEYAKRGVFKKLIVPPTTVSIYITPSRVFKTIQKRPPSGLIQAAQGYEFYGAVGVGETVRVRASIEDLYEKKGRKFVVLRGEVSDSTGSKVAVSCLTFIWPAEA